LSSAYDLTEEEYYELKKTYQSEGYGIITRLMDAKIGTMFQAMTASKKSDSEILSEVNSMKGMIESKNFIYGILKEIGDKYEDKKTK